MKNILEERQKLYRDMIEKRFATKIESLDDVEKLLIGEAINALTLGCCLQKPRIFAGKEVAAEDFRKIAKTTPYETLCVAVQALSKAKNVHNRLWYLMGVFVQICCYEPRLSVQGKTKGHGYSERTYTSEETRNVVTRVEDLSIEDL